MTDTPTRAADSGRLPDTDADLARIALDRAEIAAALAEADARAPQLSTGDYLRLRGFGLGDPDADLRAIVLNPAALNHLPTSRDHR